MDDNVDQLGKLEPSVTLEPEADMYGSISPDLTFPVGTKENRLCDLKTAIPKASIEPILVIPQQDAMIEENFDLIGELEPSVHLSPLKSKETEEPIDCMGTSTSPKCVYPEDEKESVSSLCDVESPSLRVPKVPKEAEDNLDHLGQSTSPNRVCPEDKKKNVSPILRAPEEPTETEEDIDVNSVCGLRSLGHVMPQEQRGMEENVDIMGKLEPSDTGALLEANEMDQKENVNGLCNGKLSPSHATSKELEKIDDNLNGVFQTTSPSHTSSSILLHQGCNEPREKVEDSYEVQVHMHPVDRTDQQDEEPDNKKIPDDQWMDVDGLSSSIVQISRRSYTMKCWSRIVCWDKGCSTKNNMTLFIK